jgi:hypothetical protein
MVHRIRAGAQCLLPSMPDGRVERLCQLVGTALRPENGAATRGRSAVFSLMCLAVVGAVGPSDCSVAGLRHGPLVSPNSSQCADPLGITSRYIGFSARRHDARALGKVLTSRALQLRGGGEENPGDVALRELDSFRRQGLPLNITTYNHAISECWRGAPGQASSN